MRKNRKLGRPEFKPTPEQRRKVANASGGGMAHDEIAMALGICRNTLEKHFAAELGQVACRKRLEVLDAMQRTAVKGNVAAQKAYLATSGPQGVAPPAEDEKPLRDPRGKKEIARDEAGTAQLGTSWDDVLPRHKTVQ